MHSFRKHILFTSIRTAFLAVLVVRLEVLPVRIAFLVELFEMICFVADTVHDLIGAPFGESVRVLDPARAVVVVPLLVRVVV